MNKLKEIKQLKEAAERLQLENREIIRKYSMTELAGIYNGIGPDSFPEWLRNAISALHPSLAITHFLLPPELLSCGVFYTRHIRNRNTMHSSRTAGR